MSRVTVTRVIPGPPELVWHVFVDVARRPEWLSEVDSVEMLTTGEPAPGTRWRETRVDALGGSVTEELTITDLEPGRSVTLTLGGEGEASHLTYVFAPIDVGTHAGETAVTATVESRPHGLGNLLIAFFIGELAARTAEGHLREELDELAATVAARRERNTAA
jgi:uncharacterized protein YndB with AHSA1/START domain